MSRPLDPFDETLTRTLALWDLQIAPHQLDRLRLHFEAMVETNKQWNLTRITDQILAAVKHYADSLAPLAWLRGRSERISTVLDVGTGAGFPAFPLAVLHPDWKVTAIDATRKKVEFLIRTSAAIGLKNLAIEHAHSNHWRTERKFELVVARALAPLPKCVMSVSDFVAIGGWLVAYQTANVDAKERSEADRLARDRGLRALESYEYTLHTGAETYHRVLFIYEKVG